jgi:hypothetical protein
MLKLNNSFYNKHAVEVAKNLLGKTMVFGKITELDFKNNYIYIDREVSENCLGKSVKIYSSVDNVVSEFNFSVLEITTVGIFLL